MIRCLARISHRFAAADADGDDVPGARVSSTAVKPALRTGEFVVAGVGAAVVASLSTFISVPLGALVGRGFDGTMYAQIASFAVFGACAFAAMRWAERDGGARRRYPVARS